MSATQLNNDSQRALDLARDPEIATLIRDAMYNTGEQVKYWSDEESVESLEQEESEGEEGESID